MLARKEMDGLKLATIKEGLDREEGKAVNRIKDGTITDYVYDPSTARLVERGALSPLGN